MHRRLKQLSLLIIPFLLYTVSFLLQIYLEPNNILQTKLIIIGIITLLLSLGIVLLPKDILINPKILLSLYGINTIVLIINFIIGPTIAGTKRWIPIGHFTYQPSELFKILLIIITALVYSNTHISTKNSMLSIIAMTAPILVLIFFQPDAGTTFIIVMIMILMSLKYLNSKNANIQKYLIIMLSFSFIYLLILFNTLFIILLIIGLYLLRKDLLKPYFIVFNLVFILIVLMVLFYNHIPGLKSYQKKRIQVFTVLFSKKPFKAAINEQETLSFNLKQARIAIGSGGILGKGLNNVTQSRLKFLPEYKTDFMYATISESFGLVGILVILGLYLTLIYQVNNYTFKSQVGDYLGFGFSILILTEITINMGGNLGLLPTKGIPLPYLGYGGTSMITHSILLAYISHFMKN